MPITRNTDQDAYLQKRRDLPVLTKRQTYRLIEEMRSGDEKRAARAKRKLVEHNTFLVVKSAGKFFHGRRHEHLTFEDCFQEGTLGLLKAIEKFDPSLGYAFSTYATNWIEQRIRRAYDDMDLTIRHPVHTREAIRRYYRFCDELRRKLERDPTFEEAWQEVITRYPKTSLEVKKILRKGLDFYVSSLDAPTRLAAAEGENTNGATLADYVEDEEQAAEAALEHQAYGYESLDGVIASLPPRQERLVRLYYGLITEEDTPRTLDGVGSIEGITRERVRQILEVARYNMRREFSRRGYELDSNLPLYKPRAEKKVVRHPDAPDCVDHLHLRWVRKERGYGLYELARLAGVKEKAMSAIEQGMRIPSYAELGRIARILKTPVAEFVSEVEEEVAS